MNQLKLCELPMGDLEDLIEKGGIQNALSLLTAYKSLLYVMHITMSLMLENLRQIEYRHQP